jgi:hypothetical protein
MVLNASKRIEKLVSEIQKSSGERNIAIKGTPLSLTGDLTPLRPKRGPFSESRPFLRDDINRDDRKLVLALGLWELGRKLTDLNEWLGTSPRELESYLRDRNDWQIEEFSDLESPELDEVKQALLVALFKLNFGPEFYLPKALELANLGREFGRLIFCQSLIKQMLDASTMLFGLKFHLVNITRGDQFEVMLQVIGHGEKLAPYLEKLLAESVDELSQSSLLPPEFLSFLPMKTDIKVVAE